jgi:hypothetical protein
MAAGIRALITASIVPQSASLSRPQGSSGSKRNRKRDQCRLVKELRLAISCSILFKGHPFLVKKIQIPQKGRIKSSAA